MEKCTYMYMCMCMCMYRRQARLHTHLHRTHKCTYTPVDMHTHTQTHPSCTRQFPALCSIHTLHRRSNSLTVCTYSDFIYRCTVSTYCSYLMGIDIEELKTVLHVHVPQRIVASGEMCSLACGTPEHLAVQSYLMVGRM